MRIFGINIPDEKRIAISLTYVYGIGPNVSQKILAETKIDPTKKAGQLSSEEINKIQSFAEKNFRVEGELRQHVRSQIQHLKDLKTYRGARHQRQLPVRGQRTRVNSRTVRHNVRKTAGSGKRKVELK